MTIEITPDLLNTVDQVMALAKRHEAIVKLAEVLRQIGSLDQAARETEARLERLRQEQANEQAKLNGLQQQSAVAVREIEGRRQSAEKLTRDIIAQAEGEAAELVESAGVRAAKLIADATAEATRIRQQMETVTATHQATVAALRAQAADAERAIPAAKAALADIEAKIAQAREQARRLLG